MDTEKDENWTCERCRTRRQSKQLQLMVAPCGHTLCSVCVDEIFHNRAVARCPTCSVDRRKADYEEKRFDRGEIHREVYIRTHDVKDFQHVKLEDMDPSLSEAERLATYNDFLEAAEDIAYNLSYHHDVAQTKEAMKKLYTQWEDVIVRNKRAAELERQQREMERRQRLREEKKQRRVAEQKALEARERKTREEQEFRRLLQTSGNIKSLLKERMAKKREAQAKALKMETQNAVKEEHVDLDALEAALLQREAAPLYSYQAPQLQMIGPIVPPTPLLPTYADTLSNGMCAVHRDVAEAGGYLPTYTAKRTLQETYNCLFAE